MSKINVLIGFLITVSLALVNASKTPELIPFLKGSKWGFADSTGKIVIEPKYDNVTKFSEGMAAVNIGAVDLFGGLWGYIDKTGKEVTPVQYYEANAFHCGRAIVMLEEATEDENQLYGAIDKNGQLRIKFKYSHLQDFFNGHAWAKLEDWQNYGWRLIDTTDSVIPVNTKYDYIGSYDENGICSSQLSVNDKNLWGCVDMNGKEIVPCLYTILDQYKDGLVLAEDTNYKAMFLDESGKLAFNADGYSNISGFRGGMAKVVNDEGWLNNKSGFLNKDGMLAIPCNYDDAGSFSEGLTWVTKDSIWDDSGFSLVKQGYINLNGELIIPYNYKDGKSFSEGLAAVMSFDEKWGYIDNSGKEVIPFQYDGADQFSEGLAVVQMGERFGYIDKTGKAITPVKYILADPISDGLGLVSVDGKYFFIDKSGSEYYQE